jgi:hypothetical protein
MKYYSAVLGVFKDEATFLPAWIRHYLDRGIEHIYLLDDFSSDGYEDRISDFLSDGRVTLKKVGEEDLDKSMEWRQVHLYNKYFGFSKDETFWLGVFDLDEFFYSPHTKDLDRILRDAEKTKYQELLADWYWFGSNGLEEQPLDIVGSFTMRGSKHAREYRYLKEGYHHEWCCKSFGRSESISKIRHHFNDYRWMGLEDFCTTGKEGFSDFSLNLSRLGLCHINHYVGARNYYKRKKNRGSCNNSKIVRDETVYNLLNKNEVKDTRLAEQNAEEQDDNRNSKHSLSL